MNCFNGSGYLTRDLEIRYMANGLAIGKSAVGMTRKFTQNGEKKQEVCFIDLVWFGRSAEVANQYLNKGSKITFTGRLGYSKWTDHANNSRTKNEIIVENMEWDHANTKAPSDLDANKLANDMPTKDGVPKAKPNSQLPEMEEATEEIPF